MSENLPDINWTAAWDVWKDFRSHAGIPSDIEPIIECFGDNPHLADELLDAVRSGAKRATSSMLNEYAHYSEKLPEVGGYWVICDGAGQPRAIVRTDSVTYCSFDQVDAEFAAAEGEGDLSLASWRAEHAKFWRRTQAELGITWTPELTELPGYQILQERFSVVWPAGLAD